ncbi:MAG: T9SS type A sorting domain-containing protein [Bacteroidia bacterium]
MKKNILLIVVILFIMPQLYAQPGTIDPTFNPSDLGFWKGNSLNGSITTSFAQKDGKFIIAGEFSRFNEVSAMRIARFNADGTIDTTLNKTGTSAVNIQKIVSQTDGKIFILGSFQYYNNIPRNSIARLNADGSLDNAFDPGSGISPAYFDKYAMVLQNDGKIIVGGYIKNYNGATVGNIVRINPDGKQDTTFHTGTGFDSDVPALALQSDGKVIVGGGFGYYDNVYGNKVIRLNADGSKDNTFNLNGSGPDSDVNSILLQDDGKILIIGSFKNYNGSRTHGIARLNSDGSLDNTFYVASGVFTGYLLQLCKQPDGKILALESLGAIVNQSRVFRLNMDGSLDTAFYSAHANSNASAICLQSDGKIIVGGYFKNYDGVLRNCIVRLNVDGTIDKNIYNVLGNGVNGTVWTSAIQSDGGIIIGGLFSSYNGKKMGNITRVNKDGSLDNTFHTETGTDDWIESITIQKDKKILIAGWFTKYKDSSLAGLARINIDGSLDTTLKASLGVSPLVEHVSLQSDGKILVAGYFNFNNGISKNCILRLHSNGSIDSTFKPSLGANSFVWTTLIQPDGKILVGGYFKDTVGAISVNNIARLNLDGSLDTSFHTGTGTDNVIYALGLQKDGKVLIGGSFKTYNGLTANSISRLNSNGALDNTFNSGAGIVVGHSIKNISIQQNGKIIIGGQFSNFNGTTVNSLVRLNIDGSVDNTFKNDLGARNKSIATASIQKDGNIVIGGSFTDYNGIGRNGIARVNGGEITNIATHAAINPIVIYPNPSNGEFTIAVEQIGKILIMDNLGRLILERNVNSKKEVINLTNITSGIYFARITSAHGQTTKKIIIRR